MDITGTLRLCLVLVSLIAAAPVSASEHEHHSPGAERLSSERGASFDTAFLAMMINHHRHGIEMAQLAATGGKTHRGELVQFATKMIQDQKKEIASMEKMLAESGAQTQVATTPEEKEDAKAMMAQLASEQTATGFEKRFIAEMVKHHQEAVELSELAQSRGEKVKAMAKDMADMQGKEIAQLRGWYKEWFGEELARHDSAK